MKKDMRHLVDEELIGYLENPSEYPGVEDHLNGCGLCQEELKKIQELLTAMQHSPEVDVPDTIALALERAIAEEGTTMGRQINWPYWQIAAAIALLVVGFSFGKWVSNDKDQVIALQSQVDLLKELTMVSALQNPTASQRIQAVHNIEGNQGTTNSKVIGTLIKTLNTDESPNVRYAAAQALGRFSDLENVRLELAKSLELQADPLIQIALISILTEAQEKNAIRPLQQLLEAENTAPEVKRQAEVALEILI